MLVLYYLHAAFTIWMLIDAAKRRADYYWYIIIFVPFGAWVYFFMIKIHDFRNMSFSSFLQTNPSMKELRFNVKQNPCISNKIQLAQALYENKEYQEAEQLYQEVLAFDSSYKIALYELGLCKIKREDYPSAINLLSQVIAAEKAYKNYEPWLALAFAYWSNGQSQETIKLLQKVIHSNTSIRFKTALASYLIKLQRAPEARQILEDALEEYKHLPRYIQRSDSRWIGEAKGLLKSIIYGEAGSR